MEWRLTIVPIREGSSQGEFAFGKQRKQDVCDVLRGELSIMKHAGDNACFRLGGGLPGEMQGGLPVKCRFGLEERQEDFGQSLEGIHPAVREMGFQVRSQCITLAAGQF